MLHIPGHFIRVVLRANQGPDHRSTPEDFNAGLRLGPMESVVSLRTEAVSANDVCQHSQPSCEMVTEERRWRRSYVHMLTYSPIFAHSPTHTVLTYTHRGTYAHSYRAYSLCTHLLWYTHMHTRTEPTVYALTHSGTHICTLACSPICRHTNYAKPSHSPNMGLFPPVPPPLLTPFQGR